MKKIVWIFVILSLLTAGFAFPAAAEGTDPVLFGASTLKAQVPLGGSEKRLDSAKAAILYELNTDTLLYAWNPDARINPTGMVKFMTVLLALEQGNLDDVITVKRSVVDIKELIGSVVLNPKLQPGEEITLRELLYAVMVSSANDACVVIADYIGPGRDNFVAMMNARAKELGCTGTNFVNPHGLTAENQYSTARDLAIITEAALENALFSEMFSLKDYEIPATNKSEPRTLLTTNHMMSDASVKNYLDGRVTGGKPAAASGRDRSMICTAEVSTSRYLCVVMSTESQLSADGSYVTYYGNFMETIDLIDYGAYNFRVRQVIDGSQVYSQHPVSGGENDIIVHPEKNLFTVLPQDYDPQLLSFHSTVLEEKLTAPVKKGDVLGSVSVRYGDIVLGACDLLAMFDVRPAGTVITPADRIEPEVQVKKNYWPIFKWIGIAIAAGFVLVVLIMVLIRLVRSARIRQTYRRRMRQRRRSR